MSITPDVIKRAQLGDNEAYKCIYMEYKDFIWNALWWMFKDKDMLEDVVQDVFLRIFKKIKLFTFSSDLKTWIYRLSMNFAINVAKKNEKRQFLSFDEKIRDDNIQQVDIEKMAQKDLQEKIFSRLKPENRIILILREVECLSYEDIAQILNIPKGTVRSRLSRARDEFINIYRKSEG